MTDYKPDDQDTMLPKPPWRPSDPMLQAWEAAHGHDARIRCLPEYGCLVIETDLERQLEEARAEIARLNVVIETQTRQLAQYKRQDSRIRIS